MTAPDQFCGLLKRVYSHSRIGRVAADLKLSGARRRRSADAGRAERDPGRRDPRPVPGRPDPVDGAEPTIAPPQWVVVRPQVGPWPRRQQVVGGRCRCRPTTATPVSFITAAVTRLRRSEAILTVGDLLPAGQTELEIPRSRAILAIDISPCGHVDDVTTELRRKRLGHDVDPSQRGRDLTGKELTEQGSPMPQGPGYAPGRPGGWPARGRNRSDCGGD